MGSSPPTCFISSASSRSRPNEGLSSCSRTNLSAVDLRKLLRLKKGAFWNEIATDGEIPLGGVVALLKIVPVMDALSVEVPLPGHKLDASLGGAATVSNVALRVQRI